MTYHVKISGAWKTITANYVKISGTWRTVSNMWVKISGTWRPLFSGSSEIEQAVTLSQSTNSSTGLITLTGTNYYWTNVSSLAYVFERSANDGVSWVTIKSGSTTNPSVGSSTPITYTLADNKSDVYPNVDNLYRFVVTATSSNNSTTTSTSSTQTVSASRDITNLSVVTADTTSSSVKLQFTAGSYSSSFYIRAVRGITETYYWTSSSPITISGLLSSTAYSFYVTPYTGGIVSGFSTGYGGNESSSVSETTSAPPAPIKITNPTISGTSPIGQYGTIVTGSAGSYTNANSVTTTLVSYSAPYTIPTNGESSSAATNNFGSLTHEIGQDDATTPARVFYTRDKVVGTNGNTYYYYSANSITSYIGTVTDNFNRAVTSGLGTSSSGYIYSSAGYGSWSTNGSTASASDSVNFSTVSYNYPLKTIELTGKTNLTASVKVPSGGGGPGLAFWVTSQGSWWAVAPSYYSSSSTVTTPCSSGYGTFSSPSSCGSCGYTTSSQTSSACTGSATTSTCPSPVSGSGGRCTACTTLTNYYQSCPTPTTSSPTYSNSTLGTACGDKCSCLGPYTSSSTTYSCTGSANWSGTLADCNAQANFAATAANVDKKCGSCVRNPITTQITYPTVKGTTTSTTYYHCTTRSCSDGYSYGTIVESSSTVYSCYTSSTSSTTTTYYSRLRILSTSGSPAYSVVANKDTNIASSTSAYNKIYSISVATSGDSIIAKGYDSAGTQIGSNVTYSRTSSDLGKSNSDGSSSAGIIYTPTDANPGSTFDDLSIS